MLNNKTIAVVVPAYNEETQIGDVIETMPNFVDRIIVINDCSIDNTAEIVKSYIAKSEKRPLINKNKALNNSKYQRAILILEEKNKKEIELLTPFEIYNKNPEEDRIILINHLKNGKKGGAVATGYQWCRNNKIDCSAIMDGDGQMDPDELESICSPVINEEIDYVKGNRLIHRSAWLIIPKVRYLGNSILSILTKIASGYWHISDTQTGYTAISLKALNAIRIHKIYKTYGVPNDILVKLNIAFCTIKEVEIKPVYNVGEKSKMNVFKVILPISWLLLKSFFKRLWTKYLFRDFHPLFLLYNMSFVLGILTIPYIHKIIIFWINGYKINPLTILAFMFLFISSFQSLLFAMWMDIQDNERLYKN